MASPCIACHMFSVSVSVSSEGFKCDTCRKIVRLTEDFRIRDTHPNLIEDSKNMRALDMVLDVTSLVSHVHYLILVTEPTQGRATR